MLSNTPSLPRDRPPPPLPTQRPARRGALPKWRARKGAYPLDPADTRRDPLAHARSDQRVMAHDPETVGGSEGVAAGPVGLTIRGLSPSGYLLAVSDVGVCYELTPDGNSLDMMNGLLKRKVAQ
jgi:hypothetical protein